jgi:lipid A ethanolaminephosphotransferase
MPYRFAPSEQTRVPMVLWLSEAMQRDRHWSIACVQAQGAKHFSHDNFFHTVLNLANVVTQVSNPKLDILSPCNPKP